MPSSTIDYHELMRIFSVPRLNGSRAEAATRRAVLDWLIQRNIPYRLQSFRLYPYFFIAIGAWIIVSRSLLALAIWLRWGWLALPIALLGLLGGLLDVALDIPLVSWPFATQGHNILLEFGPPDPKQELVISAHYDSKTELLDHRQRLFFVKNLPLGILLTALLGLLGAADGWLLSLGSTWATWTYAIGILLSLPLLFLAWGLGLNLSLGPMRPVPSQGAVDNGAACAILLGLAQRLADGEITLQNTRLTLALFTGEEVNMQGSRAYALHRAWPIPALALNLEVMAQSGPYVYWEQDGTAFKLVPTAPNVNQKVVQAVRDVTGVDPQPAGPVSSDGYSFLRAGIPTAVLGTYDTDLQDRGFHLPSDNLDRLVISRLPEGVEILTQFIASLDQ
ncbi:MAG: M28 family peptidase [Chloroflexota bacterium]